MSLGNLTGNNFMTGGLHGNRQASSQIYGHPLNGAGWSLDPTAPQTNAYSQAMAAMQANYNPCNQPFPGACSPRIDEPEEPIKSEGIKIGEIIGWRMWNIRDGEYLESYSAGRVWAPGDLMSGKPNDYGAAGVWAFKEKNRALQKMLENSTPAAMGSIKMWGKIVEHSLGFRAEFAKIVSIDDVLVSAKNNRTIKDVVLKNIRENYLGPFQ